MTPADTALTSSPVTLPGSNATLQPVTPTALGKSRRRCSCMSTTAAPAKAWDAARRLKLAKEVMLATTRRMTRLLSRFGSVLGLRTERAPLQRSGSKSIPALHVFARSLTLLVCRAVNVSSGLGVASTGLVGETGGEKDTGRDAGVAGGRAGKSCIGEHTGGPTGSLSALGDLSLGEISRLVLPALGPSDISSPEGLPWEWEFAWQGPAWVYLEQDSHSVPRAASILAP